MGLNYKLKIFAKLQYRWRMTSAAQGYQLIILLLGEFKPVSRRGTELEPTELKEFFLFRLMINANDVHSMLSLYHCIGLKKKKFILFCTSV